MDWFTFVCTQVTSGPDFGYTNLVESRKLPTQYVGYEQNRIASPAFLYISLDAISHQHPQEVLLVNRS
jgi:hypothetical protein